MLLSKEDVAEIMEESYCNRDFELASKLFDALHPFTLHAEILAFATTTITHLTEQNEYFLHLDVPVTWGDPVHDFEKVAVDLKEWKFTDGVRLFNYVRVNVIMTLYSEDMEGK